MKPKIPNPGSDAAQKKGCLCPILDNAHGKGVCVDGKTFWMQEDCPLHGTKTRKRKG
jgi:hypothetical protein